MDRAPENIVSHWLLGTRPPPDIFKRIYILEAPGVPIRLVNSCSKYSVYELLALGTEGRRGELRNYGRKTELHFEDWMYSSYGKLEHEEPATQIIEIKNKCPNGFEYDSLISARKIDKFINTATGDFLRENLPQAMLEETIQKLAFSLSLPWPMREWQDMTVGECIRLWPNQIKHTKGLGKTKRRTIVLILSYLAEKKALDESCELAGPLQHPVFKTLDRREEAIMQKRLLATRERTLEELGIEMKLTRERVRQIESGIFNKIKASSVHAILEKIGANLLLRLREGERTHILSEQVGLFRGELSREELLSIYTEHKSVEHWMAHFLLELRAGFYIKGKGAWDTLEAKLSDYDLGKLPLPIATIALLSGVSRAGVIAYFELTGEATVIKGYVIPSGGGRAQGLRAAQLHQYLVTKPKISIEFTDLHRDLHLSSAEARLLRIAVEGSASLFFSASNSIVVIKAENLEFEDIQIARANDACGEEIESGLRNTLFNYISKKWPITVNERVYSDFQCTFPDSKLALNSFVPILSGDVRVTRLSPGIYGPIDVNRWPNNAERMAKARGMALDDLTIRSYCFVRQASEPGTDFFPLWDPEMEPIWFRWMIESKVDDDLIESFLNVTEISCWTADQQDIRLAYLERKNMAGFHLKPAWLKNRGYAVPSFREFLATAGYLIDNNKVSWIRLNFLLGASYLTEERGLNTLILLSAFGFTEPIRRWWAPTKKAENASTIFKLFRDKTIQGDSLDWQSDSVIDMLERGRELAASKSLGAVGVDTYEALRDACLHLK